MSKKNKVLVLFFTIILFVLSLPIVYKQFSTEPKLGNDIWVNVGVYSYEPSKNDIRSAYLFKMDTNGVMEITSWKARIARKYPGDQEIDKKVKTILVPKYRCKKIKKLISKFSSSVSYGMPIPESDIIPTQGWEIYGVINNRICYGSLSDSQSYLETYNNIDLLKIIKELSKFASGKIRGITRYIP